MWIARDLSRILILYPYKPLKHEKDGVWIGKGEWFMLESDLFPEVKWEDSEPTEIKLVIDK